MALQKLFCQAHLKWAEMCSKSLLPDGSLLISHATTIFHPNNLLASNAECHPVHDDITILIPRILRYHQTLTHHAVTDIRLFLRTEETIP